MNKTLSNSDNYHKLLSCSVNDVFSNFTSLIAEYSKFCIENTFIQKVQYFKYVYLKGIETISNVFKLLLLYTKNLELTVYHCQKSFYYYIEFIGQIGDSNHQFLQLNSKDASLFVYKKTVFEINNEHRKIFCSPKEGELDKFELISELITHLNTLFSYSVETNNLDDKTERETLMHNNCDNIIKICNKMPCNNIHNSLEKMQVINTFLETMTTKDVSYEKLVSVIEALHKKILKNNVDTKNIRSNIFNSQIKNLFDVLTPLKFSNWLISNV